MTRVNIALGSIALSLMVGSMFASVAQASDMNACREGDGRMMTVDAGCLDSRRGVAWGFRPPEPMTHDEAASFCASLEPATDAAGRSVKWRLPSIKDLSALSSVENLDARVVFSPRDFYWAGGSTAGYAVAVMPLSGEQMVVKREATMATVCVSTVFGCPRETARFQTGQGGCIDMASGYVWDVIHPAARPDAAATICRDQIRHGFSDWESAPADQIWKMNSTGDLDFLYPGVWAMGPIVNGWCVVPQSKNEASCAYIGDAGLPFTCVRRPKF